MRYIIEQINSDGGVLGGRKLEIVALDNKTNPQESLVNLEQAIGEASNILLRETGLMLEELSLKLSKNITLEILVLKLSSLTMRQLTLHLRMKVVIFGTFVLMLMLG